MASDKNTAIILVAGVAVVGILGYIAYKFLKPVGDAAKSASNVFAGAGQAVSDLEKGILGAGSSIKGAFDGLQKDLTGGYGFVAERIGFVADWTAGANAPGSEADVMAKQKAAGDASALTWTPEAIARLHSYQTSETALLPAKIQRAEQGFIGGL